MIILYIERPRHAANNYANKDIIAAAGSCLTSLPVSDLVAIAKVN